MNVLTRRASVVAGVAVVVVSMMLNTHPAAATTTPTRCDDSGPKYYCSYVNYTSGSPTTGVNRVYGGNVGVYNGSNAVTWWKLWWMQDWKCTPYPSCSWLRNYGEQSQVSNSGWTYWYLPWETSTMDQDALVNFRLKLREPDGSGGDYIWCSKQMDHYLFNNTSALLGNQSCT